MPSSSKPRTTRNAHASSRRSTRTTRRHRPGPVLLSPASPYEAQIKLGQASIKQAEANLKNSEANLGYTEIVSPVDGIVIERKVDPGQTVAASFQTPELFIIAPEMDKHMYVFASVDEADIGQIRAAQEHGRSVKFTVDAYPGDLFEGTIAQIRKNSTTTQNVVTYPVVIEAPEPEPEAAAGHDREHHLSRSRPRRTCCACPAAALRFVPLPAQVRPEDRHYVEALPTGTLEGGTKRSAGEKADQARKRQHRIVWVQEGQQLRAVSRHARTDREPVRGTAQRRP